MSTLGKALAITRKDILSEVRTKEIVFSAFVFAALVIIIFNFAFGADQATMTMVAPGILWVTFSFAGVLSLSRSFVAEKEENCLEGLMIAPMPREVIYIGKGLGSLLFMVAIEVIALPFFTLLFNVPALSLPVIFITFLATVGFAAVGTVFSALAANTKARDMVLPILFFPVMVPVIISAVKGTALALAGQPWSELTSWLAILAAFDAIFMVVSFWVFPFIVEE